MKKNTNTRYRVNNTAADIFILLLLLSIATVALFVFWKDYTASASRKDKTPVAYVTFKYNTAQRKFNDRMIWDRLRQQSEIYNGDTIRTADKSEATLHFSDESTLDIDSNPLVQIFVNKDGEAVIEISSGKLNVKTSADAKPVTVKSGNNKIVIKQNSAINAAVAEASKTSDPGPIHVEVSAGSAALLSGDNARNVLETGDALVIDHSGKTKIPEGVTVLSPAESEKTLCFNGIKEHVLFNWKNRGGTITPVAVEVSTDPQFKSISETRNESSGESCAIDLKPGAYWWRIKDNSGNVDGSGKIQIIDAGPCTLRAPEQDTVFSYRKVVPQVRLVWDANEYASSYTVELSSQADMYGVVTSFETTQPSYLLNGYEPGTYYWRVTPHFDLDTLKKATASQILSFSIVQKDVLSTPVLLSPGTNTFVNYAGENKVSFSWQNDADASAYTLTLSKNKSLAEPILVRNTSSNWYTIDDKSLLDGGRYYWTVTLSDSEGNKSDNAPVQTFIAVNEDTVQKTIFPADRYSVESTNSDALVYRWKSNVPFETMIQFSKNKNFDSLVYEKNASAAQSAQNIRLGIGTYYWRLYSRDETGFTMTTAPVRLTVVPPLYAPEIRTPSNGMKYMLKNDSTLTCAWSRSAGADYYKVTLVSDDNTKTLFKQNKFSALSFTVKSSLLKKGSYTLTVQPFAAKTDSHSARSGRESRCTFTLTQPDSLRLLSPADKTTIAGLDALFTPQTVTWSSTGKMADSYFILARTKETLPLSLEQAKKTAARYKDTLNGTSGLATNANSIIMCVHSPAQEIQLVKLRPGAYYWTVCAYDDDLNDVSPDKCNSFTVSELDLLEQATLTSPENNKVFDAAAIMKNRLINFTWNKVADASSYTFTLYVSGATQKTPLLTKKIFSSEECSAQVDMIQLNEGTFIWTVEPERSLADGLLVQKGKISSGTFTIKLPDMENIEVAKPEGILYGD